MASTIQSSLGTNTSDTALHIRQACGLSFFRTTVRTVLRTALLLTLAVDPVPPLLRSQGTFQQ